MWRRESEERDPISPLKAHALAAIGHIPNGVWVMTSRFENKRAGMLVHSVQHVGTEPLMVSIACTKGHPIEPIIRDSRHFAVCRIDPDDRLVLRKFSPKQVGGEDPFECFPIETLESGAPVLKRSIAVLDCEVHRHLDIEADMEIYLGLVLAGRVYASSEQSL
jgi:flavin reductase (DIM6/NTAB) family NADH-FMN oxidoreductase RutF